MPATSRSLRSFPAATTVALVLSLSAPATAWSGAGHGDGFAGGDPGQAGEVDRSVRIEAADMRFRPDTVRVEDGETVRFVIHNSDRVEHDFTIGTPEVQAQHREEMEEMYAAGAMDPAGTPGDVGDGAMMQGSSSHQSMTSGSHGPMAGRMTGMTGSMTDQAGSAAMDHDDANAVMVPPGGTKELIWRFERARDLKFACNVPGHFESGMTGDFRFERQ